MYTYLRTPILTLTFFDAEMHLFAKGISTSVQQTLLLFLWAQWIDLWWSRMQIAGLKHLMSSPESICISRQIFTQPHGSSSLDPWLIDVYSEVLNYNLPTISDYSMQFADIPVFSFLQEWLITDMQSVIQACRHWKDHTYCFVFNMLQKITSQKHY